MNPPGHKKAPDADSGAKKSEVVGRAGSTGRSPSVRSIFFHPDYTVGTGISPVQFLRRPIGAAREVAGYNRRLGFASPSIKTPIRRSFEEKQHSPDPENLAVYINDTEGRGKGQRARVD